MKDLQETMLFVHGAEDVTRVTVTPYDAVSIKQTDKLLHIEQGQGRNSITISPETLQSIADWYYDVPLRESATRTLTRRKAARKVVG